MAGLPVFKSWSGAVQISTSQALYRTLILPYPKPFLKSLISKVRHARPGRKYWISQTTFWAVYSIHVPRRWCSARKIHEPIRRDPLSVPTLNAVCCRKLGAAVKATEKTVQVQGVSSQTTAIFPIFLNTGTRKSKKEKKKKCPGQFILKAKESEWKRKAEPKKSLSGTEKEERKLLRKAKEGRERK